MHAPLPAELPSGPPEASVVAPLLTRRFLLLSLVHFLYALALHAYVHVPGFLQQLGADEVEIGVLFSVMALVAILARPPVGWLMDTRGRRVVILASGVLHVVVCLGYLTIESLGVGLTLLRALHGLAEAMMFASLFTYAADIIPAARRTQGIAIFGVSGLLPMAVGGVLGDAVLAVGTYRDLFWLTVALSAVALVGTLPLAEPARNASAAPAKGFFRASTQRDLLPLWLLGTVFALVLSTVFVFIKTFVIATGVGSVGLFLSAYAVAASVLRLLFSWIPDRLGPKRALYPSLGVLAVGIALLSRATTSGELVTAGILAGLGHGFTFPIIAGMVVTRAPEADRGSALSTFTAMFDVGMLIGGPAFGFVLRQHGHSTMYALAAALALAGAAAFAAWDRGR